MLVFKVKDTMPEYNAGDRINVDRASLEKEISLGLHKVTGRPISALLNHCELISDDDKAAAAISELMESANEPLDPSIAAVDSARAVAEGKEFERKPLTDNEVRAKAKDLGIRNWHNMSIDNLLEKIKEVEAE